MRKTTSVIIQLAAFAFLIYGLFTDISALAVLVCVGAYFFGTAIGTQVTYTQEETENEETN